MPIASPEIYAEMLDRAKALRVSFQAVQVRDITWQKRQRAVRDAP